MGNVTLIINGKRCQAEEGEKVLEVALRNGFEIPYLCHHPALDPYGACRLCLVEVVGCSSLLGLTTSCTLPVTEGISILTESPLVVRHRSILFEMYLSMAPDSERVRELAERHGVRSSRFEKRVDPDDPLGGKCVLCGLCVRVCHQLLGRGAVDFVERGSTTRVATPFLEPSPACTGCGACAAVCPTGAIFMEDSRHIRVMHSWAGTEIPLTECPSCGQYHLPSPLTEDVKRKGGEATGHFPEDIWMLCQRCRRKKVGSKLASMPHLFPHNLGGRR